MSKKSVMVAGCQIKGKGQVWVRQLIEEVEIASRYRVESEMSRVKTAFEESHSEQGNKGEMNQAWKSSIFSCSPNLS